MIGIEQQGPYTIERKGLYSIDVTSDVQFSATLSFDEYAGYPVPVMKTGNRYSLIAMALTESMALVLSSQGYSDVVIRNNSEDIEETKEGSKCQTS